MMIIFFESLLLVFGFTLLSLSLPRHYSQVYNERQQLSVRILWRLRISGYILIIASMILAINTWGVALGLVYWFAYATPVTFFLSLVFAFKPRWLAFIPHLFNLICHENTKP